ncbi:MAG: hypothetical protein ACQERJ_05350 [Bacillota bacterium]
MRLSTKDESSAKDYSLGLNQVEAKIGIGHLPEETTAQTPGYLAVKINNYPLQDNDFKFFGVSKQGDTISGPGVRAEKIAKPNQQEMIALFDISDLVGSGQFTEETVEGIITAGNQEISRNRVNYNSEFYLG